MPSPIAHSLAGFAVYRGLCQKSPGNVRPGVAVLVAVVAANLPDFDFVPGLLTGNANRFHHALTHSLAFLLMATLAVYLLARMFRSSPAVWALLVGLGVASHLVLDFFTVDTRAPFGIPLLWPLSSKAFLFPHPFFLDIQRSANPLLFFPSLFSRHNLQAVWREILLTGSAVLLLELRCRFSRQVPRD